MSAPQTYLQAYGAQMPRYPLGVNATGMNYAATVWDSPDLMMCAGSPDLLRIQATLAAPYVGGSGVMQLAGPNPFTVGQQNGTITGGQIGFLNTTGGIVSFILTSVAGSPYVYITQWGVPAQDVGYPAGTYINHYRNNWQNQSPTPADWPVRPELVVAGRHTGYPAGMGNGQAITISVNPYFGSQVGNWTVLASGTGTLQFNVADLVGGTTVQAVTVAAGVPSGPLVIASGHRVYQVVLAGSSDPDPLHDVRVVCPDRPGHADDFVATYRANSSDPNYILIHPDLVASLRPFEIVRYMDLLGANNNPMVINWADRPSFGGIGMGIGAAPYEYVVARANQTGCDLWWTIPITATDEHVTNLATFLLDNVDAPIKIGVERGNENWNNGFEQYYFCGRMKVATLGPSVVGSIAYSAGICTVSMAAHGFADGATIQVENCGDDGYNGAHVITKVDVNTFTYTPSSPPTSSPAVARACHGIFALDAGSQWALPAVTSIVWDGFDTITVTTSTAHNLTVSDVVQTANAADPAWNSQWWVLSIPGATTFTIAWGGDQFNRPMPSVQVPHINTATAKSGQALRAWKVAYTYDDGAEGNLPYSLSAVYTPYRSAQDHKIIHDIFAAAGQADRLIYVLAWQMPFNVNGWQANSLWDAYLTYLGLGGSFLSPGETALSCAPYFGFNKTNILTYVGTPFAISSLTSSGGVATATTAAAHGFPDGATVQVANVLQPQYCGLFAIAVTGPTTFTYPVPGSPISPASPANGTVPGGMIATLDPPYTRELTAVSTAGGILTCTSPAHGWTTGHAVHLCSGIPAGASYLDPDPAIYGLFGITALDADTFTVPIAGTGAYTLPTASTRMWAWDDAALVAMAADLATLDILSAQFVAATAALSRYPGATLRCYEGGATFGGDPAYPPAWDILRRMHESQQMGDIYTSYIEQLYTTYRVTSWNQYNHIEGWGSAGLWGTKEFQHERNNPKYIALMQLCAGTPDYADGGGPAPGAGVRRWFPGLVRSRTA